jgi:hypothetical protein
MVHVPAAAFQRPLLEAHADWHASVGQLFAPWLLCLAAESPTLLPLVPTVFTASRVLDEDLVLLLEKEEHLHMGHGWLTWQMTNIVH